MGLSDDEVESQVHGWRLLAVLHARIEAQLERVLQVDYQLSVSEYGVLELLARQQDHHLRMNQLATAGASTARSPGPGSRYSSGPGRLTTRPCRRRWRRPRCTRRWLIWSTRSER